MYDNIPAEMRFYNQWVVWRYEETDGDKPTKVPYSALTGRKASVTDPSTWVDYDYAIRAMQSGSWSGIGFVLTKDDPYWFIDLDDPYQKLGNGAFKYIDPEKVYNRQQMIFAKFQTYAELSPSGSGLHLIGKGQGLPHGRKREAIEVYTSERFMTMTGNVYRPGEVTSGHDELLSLLWQEMGGPATIHQFQGGEEKEPDEVILDRAMSAENGAKFKALWEGDWQSYYSSQSEGDLALIDIVAFYTDSREQIRRMFLNSGLANRDKAKRRNYQEYMINKCFDRKLPPIDTEGLRLQFEEMLRRKAGGDEVEVKSPPALPDAQPGRSAPASGEAYAPRAGDVKPIHFPPGLVGEIAQFIYDQSSRPVLEIALIGAIGLMAGISGRAYNVSGTGLNGYFLLIADTGTGKEAINQGISLIMTAVRGSSESGCPACSNFVGPSEIASAPALLKALGAQPCFVSVVGEFGLKLKQLSDDRASSHEIGLRRVLLDLFAKSGRGNVLNPMIYSDNAKNTPAVLSPSFSIIGESTGERFYEALNENMVTEGLLPRFTTMEYKGPRPPRNIGHEFHYPSPDLVDRVRTLASHCLEGMARNLHINIELAPNATATSDRFDIYCDSMINSAGKELNRQLWNRAHLKALKLAGIVAVGENPFHPVISEECINWAIDIIIRDIENLLSKFERGEVGMLINGDELAQEREICKAVLRWFTSPHSDCEKYGITNKHYQMKAFPYQAIQRRTASAAVFRKDRKGATLALKATLQNMCDTGVLVSISKKQHGEMFGLEAIGYMVGDPDRLLHKASGGI